MFVTSQKHLPNHCAWWLCRRCETYEHPPPPPCVPPRHPHLELMGKRPFSHPSTDIESSRPASVYQQYPPMQERWFAWLVPLFFIVNIAAFVYSMYVNDCPSNVVGTDHCVLQKLLGRFSFQPLSQNPLFGPSSSTLEKMGALEWKLVVKEGEGWRLISCIWLHAGVIHLLANMISLIFVGIRLEEEFGFVKIGLLYVLSGFGGSLLSSISLRSTMSVGASGALFGLLGAMLSELITNWTIYANKCAALLTLVLVIALNLAVGILPHVDNSAHIGGFLSGFFLGFILLIRPQFGWVSRKQIPHGFDIKFVKPKYKCYQYLMWITAFVILITGYATGLGILYSTHRKRE